MKRRNIYMIMSAFALLSVSGLSACGSDELSVSTVAESSVEETEEETESRPTYSGSENETIVAAESKDAADEVSEDIYVYICGAVSKEGVYKLSSGSRIQDALDMAGGYSEDAAHGYVNLAEVLTDGMRIYIPTEQEVLDSGSSVTDGTWNAAQPDGSKVDSTLGSEDESKALVDINTADSNQLQTLPGIGESKARDIINYRETNGPFGDIEEIKNVSGIGESTYDKLSPYITVK